MPGTRSARATRSELAAVAVLLAIAAALLSRRLAAPSANFDEAVYLASGDLLARGLELGRDVFTSQPPLFLAAVGALTGWIGGPEGLRAVAVALTLAGATAGWALLRLAVGPRAAFGGLALVLLAPGVGDAAAVVSADVPCFALGTIALLAARLAERRPRWGLVAGGMLVAAGLVKLLAAPFAVALLARALVVRPGLAATGWAAAGGALVLLGTGAAYHDVLGELWAGAVGLHLDARGSVRLPGVSDALVAVLVVCAYLGLLVLLVTGVAAHGRERLRRWAVERAELLGLLAGGVLVCALQEPLLEHHLVALAWPMALLAGSSLAAVGGAGLRGRLALGAGALLLLPWVAHGRDTVDAAELRDQRAAAALLAARTPPGAVVVSDLPTVPLLAGRVTAAATVDASYVRVGTGSLDRDEVLAAAADADAVVAGRAFTELAGLDARLRDRFPAVGAVGGVRLYLRR